MTEHSSRGPHTLLEHDGSAIVGVLSVVAAAVLSEQCDTELLAELGYVLERAGAVTDASGEQVSAALGDLIAQVRYVVDQDEDERPERGLARPAEDRTAPPKGVSGLLVAREVPLGKGPTASCVLGSVVAYPTGVEIELNLAWRPTSEELALRDVPRAHGSFAPGFLDGDPVGDWRVRVDVPDGRSATAVLAPRLADMSSSEDEVEADLQLHPQSVQTRVHVGSMTARWLLWLPLEGVPSVAIASSWPSGAIPETRTEVDLSEG